jgi:hypothetical protein
MRLHAFLGLVGLAMDVDLLSPEETLVPDARAGVTPSELVDRKFLAALGAAAAARPPSRWGPRPEIQAGTSLPPVE